MKRLAESRQLLVASPMLLDRILHPRSPSDLTRLPGIGMAQLPDYIVAEQISSQNRHARSPD
jgi:hypothetical protein